MAFPNGCSNVRHLKPGEQPSRFFADAARSIVVPAPFKLVDNANYAAPQLCAFARLHQPLAVGLVTQSRVGVKAHKHRANYLVVRKPERRILHATCIESQPIISTLTVWKDAKAIAVQRDTTCLV